MLKKTVCLLFAWSLFLSPLVYAQNITLGYVDFPPYEFENNGQPGGLLVTIVKTLFGKADIQLELIFLPFKRAFENTKSGKIDGLFNFYKTEERLIFFDYTEPVIKNPLVFFVRKDAIVRFNQLEDLKGLRVGVMVGYTYGMDFDENTTFIRDTASSHGANFKKLVMGRIDTYPCDRLVGIYVAMQYNLMSELKILPEPLNVMDGYIGFTKGKHQETIRKINKVLSVMNQNGEIKQIIDQFFEKNDLPLPK